jgi:hypothetical protein
MVFVLIALAWFYGQMVPWRVCADVRGMVDTSTMTEMRCCCCSDLKL